MTVDLATTSFPLWSKFDPDGEQRAKLDRLVEEYFPSDEKQLGCPKGAEHKIVTQAKRYYLSQFVVFFY